MKKWMVLAILIVLILTWESCTNKQPSQKLVWKYPTGPVQSSSMVFHEDMIFVGSTNNFLFCLGKSTGELIWKCDLKGPVWSISQVNEEKIYIGAGKSISCVNIDKGQLLWQYKTQGDVYSVPYIYDKKVYAGSTLCHFYCLDTADGSLIWDYETERESSATGIPCKESGIYTSPCGYDKMVYIGTDRGYVYCLDAESGKLLWKYTIGGETHSSLKIRSPLKMENGKLYVSSLNNGYTCALDGKTGTLIWAVQLGGGVQSIPVLEGEKLYLGSDDTYVYCIDSSNGKIIWKYKTGGEVQHTLLIDEENLFTASTDKYIYRLNKDTGTLIQKYKFGDWVAYALQIYGKNLYIGTSSDYFYCYEVE